MSVVCGQHVAVGFLPSLHTPSSPPSAALVQQPSVKRSGSELRVALAYEGERAAYDLGKGVHSLVPRLSSRNEIE